MEVRLSQPEKSKCWAFPNDICSLSNTHLASLVSCGPLIVQSNLAGCSSWEICTFSTWHLKNNHWSIFIRVVYRKAVPLPLAFLITSTRRVTIQGRKVLMTGWLALELDGPRFKFWLLFFLIFLTCWRILDLQVLSLNVCKMEKKTSNLQGRCEDCCCCCCC